MKTKYLQSHKEWVLENMSSYPNMTGLLTDEETEKKLIASDKYDNPNEETTEEDKEDYIEYGDGKGNVGRRTPTLDDDQPLVEKKRRR